LLILPVRALARLVVGLASVVAEPAVWAIVVAAVFAGLALLWLGPSLIHPGPFLDGLVSGANASFVIATILGLALGIPCGLLVVVLVGWAPAKAVYARTYLVAWRLLRGLTGLTVGVLLGLLTSTHPNIADMPFVVVGVSAGALLATPLGVALGVWVGSILGGLAGIPVALLLLRYRYSPLRSRFGWLYGFQARLGMTLSRLEATTDGIDQPLLDDLEGHERVLLLGTDHATTAQVAGEFKRLGYDIQRQDLEAWAAALGEDWRPDLVVVLGSPRPSVEASERGVLVAIHRLMPRTPIMLVAGPPKAGSPLPALIRLASIPPTDARQVAAVARQILGPSGPHGVIGTRLARLAPLIRLLGAESPPRKAPAFGDQLVFESSVIDNDGGSPIRYFHIGTWALLPIVQSELARSNFEWAIVEGPKSDPTDGFRVFISGSPYAAVGSREAAVQHLQAFQTFRRGLLDPPTPKRGREVAH
jgi:hypothetical protein